MIETPHPISFKRGSSYTRPEIFRVCEPDSSKAYPGGNWETSYHRVGSNLMVFMNIGLPGTTGHDFDNQFDSSTNTIVWYGKPNSHSGQPIFQGLLAGKLTPHFFARWELRGRFVYLGTGSIINFEDGIDTKHGKAIRCVLTSDHVGDIIDYSTQQDMWQHLYKREPIPSEIQKPNLVREQPSLAYMPEPTQPPSSFLLEKHLEEYIVSNWEHTVFGRDYNIYENDHDGRQYPTDTGPLDILAESKDRSQYLVLELKRNRASDVTVGQTLRYMGYIQKTLADGDPERVKGCIIAAEEDKGLMNAISAVPNMDFYRYQINFTLNRVPG